jgi:ATP-dependent Lon protease
MAQDMHMDRPGGIDLESPSIPSELPILPVKESIIYPKMVLPMIVTAENQIKMIDDALVGDRMIGLVAIMDEESIEARKEGPPIIGTVVLILKMLKMPDNTLRLLIQGISRIRIIEFTQTEPYFKARIEKIEEKKAEGVEVEALTANIKGLFKTLLDMSPHLPPELAIIAVNIEDPGNLADLVAANLNIGISEKQEILETIDVMERLKKVHEKLTRAIQILELGSKIQSQVKDQMEKMQREYYLREQLKAIQRELGEKDERSMEIEELREKVLKSKMTDEAREAAQKEIERLSKMPPAAAEYIVSRTYLDWLIELPWGIMTEDNLDIDRAQRILDEDHYNLEKVKKRILEFLAVRRLKEDMKGPILCFVGPPGTGKTSLGRSIARALGRKFVRISLGGIRDEAEIRGHRRTYVGALPGRIIQGIRKAGSSNPVFMLDEVDKIGMDFRGDPSSALLEVLDPEQNYAFSDHYLEVGFDLSKVMFITTANLLEPIPPALRDRMEVLDLVGYTPEEKVYIARKFLIPRQLEEHGLKKRHLRFTKKAIEKIIKHYTREAGLRNLEREIATICRAVAKEVASGKDDTTIVKPKMVHEFLGPEKFFSEVAERTAQPGVATGMAWTPSGGDILFVEATRMPGKKTLTLTGQLGDIMKESAQTALSYIRSRAKELKIDEDFFEKNDIHIHVPEGAIPKDGPSAGVTILTALASLLMNRRVRNDVAMTGEITLRGLVLPVGGIKEKVLAAKRAGIRTIILPKKNEKDLEEIPDHMKKGLQFHFVSRMDEVIRFALTPSKRKDSPSTSSSRPSK